MLIICMREYSGEQYSVVQLRKLVGLDTAVTSAGLLCKD